MTPEEERLKEVEETFKALQDEYGPKIDTAVTMAHVILKFGDVLKGKFPIAELAKKADDLLTELEPIGDILWESQKKSALRRAKLVEDIARSFSNIDGATAWAIVSSSNPMTSIVQLAETAKKQKKP